MVNGVKWLALLLSVILVAGTGCSSSPGPVEEEPLPPVPADEAVTQRIAALLRAPASEQVVLALQREISRLLANGQAPQDTEQVVRSSLLAAVETPADIDALFELQRQAGGGVFSTRFSQAASGAGALALCEDTDAEVVVYFINGIMNTLPEALTSLHMLEAATRSALAGAGTVDYRLFYNPTSIPGDDGSAADWCQSFGFLAAYGQVSEAEKQRLRGLAESRCGDRGVLADLSEVVAQLAGGMNSLAEQDWLTARFHDVVRNDVLSGKRVIIVPHSQGNIYTRSMVQRLMAHPEPLDGDLGPSIGVVSLGSPVSFPDDVASFVGEVAVVKVQYDLASLVPGAPAGNVVNELSVAVERELIKAAVRAAWGTLMVLLRDRAGFADLRLAAKDLGSAAGYSLRAHLMSGSYLASPVIEAIRGAMAAVASHLQNPRARSGQGFLQVALTWNQPGDIDLYVREPRGAVVYYGDRYGQDGELDRDDITGTGPENYYICAPSALSEGEYQVSVNNYNGELGTQAGITVRAGSKSARFTKIMDEPNQGDHLLPIATIRYDAGSLSISPAP